MIYYSNDNNEVYAYNTVEEYELSGNDFTHHGATLPTFIEQMKDEKRVEVKQAYIDGKYADLDFQGATYDFPNGPLNQADLASLIAGGVSTVAWLDSDNNVGIDNLDDLKAFSLALNDRAAKLFVVKHTKLAMVEIVTTKAKVRAI